MITEIPIPKDTTILVGVMSSNTSKALWGEDAYEWKPARWLSPLPETITEAKIPGVYSNLFVSQFALLRATVLLTLGARTQNDVLGRRSSLHVSHSPGRLMSYMSAEITHINMQWLQVLSTRDECVILRYPCACDL